MLRERWTAPVLVILILPYYLNDFANIYIRDWRLWLLIDYLPLKLGAGLYLVWLLRRGALSADDLGLRRPRMAAFFGAAAFLSLFAIVVDQNAYRWLAGLPGYPPLGAIPTITSPFWNWFDLTVGLLAVGFFEEVVFRGLFACLCAPASAATTVVCSATAFGLIHWSNGLHAVLVTAAIGAVFMGVYLRTRSLAAPIAAHFVVNFVAYSGLFPPDWFRLF